jgi:hypothetical protein
MTQGAPTASPISLSMRPLVLLKPFTDVAPKFVKNEWSPPGEQDRSKADLK